MDTVLAGGIIRLSNKFYNQGLAKLGESNLTEAIQLLNKSIAINKSNVTARNLLGLALFEHGQVGEAVRQWLLSDAISQNLTASSYLERASKNQRAIERFNEAIKMYNNALAHLRNKSDDLAIIQLKRAVEIHPRFVDALNLLALCHMIQNDKERARAIVDRVLDIDKQNPIASRYFAKLNPGKARTMRTVAQQKPKQERAQQYKPIGMPDKKSSSFHIKEILFFIVGAACGVAIIYFLLFPALELERENDEIRANNQLEEVQSTHSAELAAVAAEIETLQNIISDRDFTINELNQNMDHQDRMLHIQQAFLFYHEGQLRDAIDMLDDLDESDLPFDIRNRISAIYASAYPRLGITYFNQGIAASRANDPYLAIPLLEDALRFLADTATNAQRRDLFDALGTLYYEADRLEEALYLLTIVRRDFPGHRPNGIGNMITRINNRL